MSKKSLGRSGLAVAFVCLSFIPLKAHAPSGAIFTTLENGSEVNYNIYEWKDHVYLDGGPGVGAPQTAAGLDAGTYVFQVTDPSGKTLLSQDIARCRQFTVANGVISSVVVHIPVGADKGCQHATGLDVDHNAVTVQLMPYLDTPNPGGEYKVWITTVDDFELGCEALGVANGLDVVNCGGKTGGNAHGFIPRHSKTDNFKVGGTPREIDTRFRNGQIWGEFIDGLSIEWTDPLGATNKKWSYLNVALDINHEAHVEAVENGTHLITITDQPGCNVGEVYLAGNLLRTRGPHTVKVSVSPSFKGDTIFVDVVCQ